MANGLCNFLIPTIDIDALAMDVCVHSTTSTIRNTAAVSD